jgi:hypothetical protein
VRRIGRWQAVDPTIDEGSNAYGLEEVERHVGERPTMVSQYCLSATSGIAVQTLARAASVSRCASDRVRWPSKVTCPSPLSAPPDRRTIL